jgi:hypothetical protein
VAVRLLEMGAVMEVVLPPDLLLSQGAVLGDTPAQVVLMCLVVRV